MNRLKSFLSGSPMLTRRGVFPIGLLLAGCGGQNATTASVAAAVPLASGTARIWFLRPADPPNASG
jgi:hypothetical protein